MLKRLGDGVMALFGYPSAQENDAERAVRAALAIQRAKAAIGKLSDENADVQSGINIVLRALEAPIRQIAENSGVEGGMDY